MIEDETVPRLRRRQLLGLLGGATAVGLAGCQAAANQSFEASSVGLSRDLQETLQLGEVYRNSQTSERSGAGGNVSLSITTHTAVYSRAVALGGS